MDPATQDDEPEPAEEARASEPSPVPGDGPRPTRYVTAPRVPGYRIEGVIGRGATGTVYRAVQLAVEREVALKVLHPELARKPRVVQRLQREARTMARLAHPHVVGAIDMGEVDGRWWFAMELVDGPSLSQTIRTSGPLGERDALRLFAPLCEALEHLWEHGVVHRDIKPANILLERTGRGDASHMRARLADLGLAVAEHDPNLTRQGGTLGTPHYISPEQAKDPRGVDVRSDLWALGATLFHAVCGRPPFTGDSAAEVLSAVLSQPIPDPRRLNPRVSPGLALVLRKCLVRDPDRRYQTPAELLADLERLRERRAPLVQRSLLDPLERDPRPWHRPLPWVATLGVAAALGLAWWTQRPATRPSDQGVASNQYVAELSKAREYIEAAESDPINWIAALDELESVRADVAASDLWPEFYGRAIDGLERTTAAIRASQFAKVRSALQREDFVAADMAFEDFDVLLRRRLGRGVAELPRQVGDRLVQDLEVLREQIDDAVAARTEYFAGAALAHYTNIVEPKVDELLAQERWRSAWNLLERDSEEILVDADLPVDGLPSTALEDAASDVLTRAATRRGELSSAWIERQRGLNALLADATDAFSDLRWPEIPGDPAGVLAEVLETELQRLGLDRDEALFRLEADARLADDAAKARDRAGRNLAEGALADLALRRSTIHPSLASRRQYEDLVRLWTQFVERCESVPASLTASGWAEDRAREARVRLREAELLRSVMERATDALMDLRGREARFEVGPNITTAGRVKVLDEERGEFRLDVPPSGSTLMSLRGGGPQVKVVVNDVERLAGLDGPERDLDPEDHLALACFRLREGRLRQAPLGAPTSSRVRSPRTRSRRSSRSSSSARRPGRVRSRSTPSASSTSWRSTAATASRRAIRSSRGGSRTSFWRSTSTRRSSSSGASARSRGAEALRRACARPSSSRSPVPPGLRSRRRHRNRRLRRRRRSRAASLRCSGLRVSAHVRAPALEQASRS
ncbi:MAG: serine/threonine-protein kinase [Planctomycetota bacterium]